MLFRSRQVVRCERAQSGARARDLKGRFDRKRRITVINFDRKRKITVSASGRNLHPEGYRLESGSMVESTISDFKVFNYSANRHDIAKGYRGIITSIPKGLWVIILTFKVKHRLIYIQLKGGIDALKRVTGTPLHTRFHSWRLDANSYLDKCYGRSQRSYLDELGYKKSEYRWRCILSNYKLKNHFFGLSKNSGNFLKSHSITYYSSWL